MIILGICDSHSVLEVLRIIKIVINIIKIVVPIALIISLMITYMGAVSSGNDDTLAKANKTLISRFIAAIAIFLMPTLVNVVISIVAPTSELSSCLEMSNTESINNLYFDIAIDNVRKTESSLSENDYNDAIQSVKEVKDQAKQEELLERLEKAKEKIKESKKEKEFSNNESKNNTINIVLTDTIFMGDSRTVGMKSVINSANEKTIAKSGANYYDFLDHISSAKSILNSNSTKSYNIVLNYGVNDLYNIKKYCADYNSFISSIGSNNKIYIESVNPLGPSRDNSGVVSFNSSIKSCVTGSNIYYCDVYNSSPLSTWQNDYVSSDNIHYTSSGYNYIYNEIKKCINSQ